jgi:hypothetical protein
MITQEEWNQLKDNERFGMIINLMKRVEILEKLVNKWFDTNLDTAKTLEQYKIKQEIKSVNS